MFLPTTLEEVQRLGWDALDVILVTAIGCHGIIDKSFNTHTVHGLHGRSVALGAGVSAGLMNPGKKVIVFLGDGGATIGVQHIIDAAHNGYNMTVVIHNIMLYGMTGGQPSEYTPFGFKTPTKPGGSTKPSYDICKIVSFCSMQPANPDKRAAFHGLYRELVHDEARNRQICADVMEVVRTGRFPLILTERNEHLDLLEQELAPTLPYLGTLRAGMGQKQRQAIAARLDGSPQGEGRVLLATGRYIGEGFDDARLDTLFLTLPISWRGTVAQYAGRLAVCTACTRASATSASTTTRTSNVQMLSRMFDRRCRGYEQIGYKVLLPASAIPGWPNDVPLPSDPVWKRDYAGSVRRLVLSAVSPAFPWDSGYKSLMAECLRIP